MAIKDSTTGKTLRNYSIDELKEAANLMRGYDLVALCAAGSGHAGGTLSIMDITAACGFQSPPHFSKCYRNQYGYPPSAERKIGGERAAKPNPREPASLRG